jgi:tRNA nucleotidyltransferase (CCA-adding enzyme)
MNTLNPEIIPPFVSHVTKTLQDKGFEAYLVGGCVRDLLLGKNPKDWDITTNAQPEQIQQVFISYKTVYENTYGTVSVINMPPLEQSGVTRETPDYTNQAQVTTYRSEGNYTDNRHPNIVTYETKLEKDLERRDFTINAMAFDPSLWLSEEIIMDKL